MSTISIIAAIADKSAIGKNQQLLCHMPSDMKRFLENSRQNVYYPHPS